MHDLLIRSLATVGVCLVPALVWAGTSQTIDSQEPAPAQASPPQATPPAPAPPQQPAPAAPPRPAAPAPAQGAAARQPPAGSAPVVRIIELRFPRQENVSVIEPQTYLYYIQTKPSRPSENFWSPYDEKVVREDFLRLWNTNFLDDVWVEANDLPYPNGVVGKHVIFNLEERQRVKIVDYVGSKKLEQTKIDEKLKEKGLTIRLDSFIDPGLIRRVEGIVREMLSEKGYLGANITHEVKSVQGGPKLVHLTFNIAEGPQYKIRDIEFLGNKEVSDGSLGRRMKENKEPGMFGFITGKGTYQETKFEEDAEKVVEYYLDRGYINARVGSPDISVLQDSSDGKKRFVQLRIPVEEGRRYKVGNFNFEGNTVVKSEALRPLFKMEEGEFYAQKDIKKGLEKAREVYGTGGYFEFTGFPDLKPRDLVDTDGDGQPDTPADAATARGPTSTADGNGPAGSTNGKGATNGARAAAGAPPIVDVTMRLQEGDQYFVNRITFVGNNTTRDNVIRREIRLFEGGVFNTEALKYSIKRLNQLGYFKNLEGDAIKVDKSAEKKSNVDVTLKLEEQNRNQLTFGAGVSQFEGFFGQLSFQTANFMGRGETLTLALQAGSRSQNYQIAFTEPFLFDRPITAGFDVFKREIRYINQFTQGSLGGNIVFGFPLRDFTRGFLSYAYEDVQVRDLNPLYYDPEVINNNPFLADALLIGENGRRRVSKIVPSVVHNTVDNPIFPTTGKRLTASVDFAGLGGNVNFIKPRLEAIKYFQHTRRTSFGVRGQFEWIQPYGSTQTLPIFERLFLGGEYSVRGFDIRSIGPRDPITGLVIGGTKSLLFNAEYLISIAGPVRLVLFYDAGQVRNRPLNFTWDEFKTSTGAEIRFFMPVLNVPFRLIFASNPQRSGVFDNNLEPTKSFTFRFAVGSTF